MISNTSAQSDLPQTGPTTRQIKIPLLIALLTAGVSVLWMSDAAKAIEEAEYEVVRKDGGFELRRYQPHIVAETFVEGDFKGVGNQGFRRLYDYISGRNRKTEKIATTSPVGQEADSQKIAMTAPVNQEQRDNRFRITFMMPAEYTLESLPEPLDPAVVLKEEPGRLMAAIRYSGTWSRKRYLEREKRLMDWLTAQGYRVDGSPVFARYDPPFMPWFLRRNEVLIPIKEGNASEGS